VICHRKKIIFIHIPKTGGTSVSDSLFVPRSRRTTKDLWMGQDQRTLKNKYQTGGLQHLYAKNILLEVGKEVFSEYFKFCFVRNPWSKLVSQYHWTLQSPRLMKRINIGPDSSFEKYLDNLIISQPHVQWEPQNKFIYDDQGTSIINFIGRYEKLQQDFDVVCDTIGAKHRKLSHAKNNSRGRKHYTDFYNKKTRKIVEEKYRKDIECFGYTFTGE